VVFVAASVGDIAAYELAKFFSERFRSKLRRFSFFRDNEKKARKLLKKHEFSIVFWTRWLFFALCAVVSYVAGFEEIDRKKFITAVLVGEFLYAVVHSVIGYFLGEVINNLISTVTNLTLLLALLAVVIYLIRYFVKKRKS
jgi:membrane protein DedA with SNARE-associated domain